MNGGCSYDEPEAPYRLPDHPVLERCIAVWGEHTRQPKAAEEAAELTAALCKGLTVGSMDMRSVAGEAADVLLTLSMLCKVTPGLKDLITREMNTKLLQFEVWTDSARGDGA